MSRIRASELRDAVLDSGSFTSWGTTPVEVLTSVGYARELAEARDATGIDKSALTGEAGSKYY